MTYSSGLSQYILTGCSDRLIRLYNPSRASSNSAGLIQTYQAHGYEVLDLAVSEDNARFVSVGGDKIVFLWDVATANTLRRFQGHAGKVECCVFAGEGDSVVVTGVFCLHHILPMKFLISILASSEADKLQFRLLRLHGPRLGHKVSVHKTHHDAIRRA